MLSYASNAILSKARAKYGRRLTEKDYQSLFSCQTVSEAVSYLKNSTHYSQILLKVNETDVHRGQVEMLLRRQLFYDFASLCRYEISVGEHFSEYIIERYEIDQIIRFLTLLGSESAREYLYALPMYFDKHTSIDLQALANAGSYSDFLKIISHSRYFKVLEPFTPKNGAPLDIAGIEHELYRHLYANVFNIIDKYTKGSEQKELRSLFDKIVDYNNFVRILRLKKYFKMNPDEIKANLLPFGTLSKKSIDAMANAESSKDVFAIMQGTMTGKSILKMEYGYVGEISLLARYVTARKQINFSVYPSVVLLSYMFITETELSNVINIIEGIRYRIPPEQIKVILVGFNDD